MNVRLVTFGRAEETEYEYLLWRNTSCITSDRIQEHVAIGIRSDFGIFNETITLDELERFLELIVQGLGFLPTYGAEIFVDDGYFPLELRGGRLYVEIDEDENKVEFRKWWEELWK